VAKIISLAANYADPDCPLPVWDLDFTCGYFSFTGQLALVRDEYTGGCILQMSGTRGGAEEEESQDYAVTDCAALSAEFTLTEDYVDYLIKISPADCDACIEKPCDCCPAGTPFLDAENNAVYGGSGIYEPFNPPLHPDIDVDGLPPGTKCGLDMINNGDSGAAGLAFGLLPDVGWMPCAGAVEAQNNPQTDNLWPHAVLILCVTDEDGESQFVGYDTTAFLPSLSGSTILSVAPGDSFAAFGYPNVYRLLSVSVLCPRCVEDEGLAIYTTSGHYACDSINLEEIVGIRGTIILSMEDVTC